MKKLVLLISLILLLSISFVYAENNSDNSSSDLECNNYYWIDNYNTECGQKEFCGAYMYQGLQTFEEREDCLDKVNGINKTDDENNENGEDEEDNETEDVVCTQEFLPVCCKIEDKNKIKSNQCVCEKQSKGIIVNNNFCNNQELKKELKELRKEYRGELKEILKDYNGEAKLRGKNVTIRELSNERREIIADKINAKTGLNLTAEDIDNQTILRTLLSNGRNAEIKIMPDRASEIALSVLRVKCEIRNCIVELKEVGIGNKTRLAYAIEMEKSSKLFLIFKNKMIVKAQIDAETGEVISVKKPWWAFMAREEKDKDVENKNNENVESENNENENSILDCGFEQNVNGQGYNQEARECFYNAFLECKKAKFKVSHSTIEGDLVTNIFTILGMINNKCQIKNNIKSDDQFGKQGTFENICTNLNKKAFNQQDWFELTDCENESIGFNFA